MKGRAVLVAGAVVTALSLGLTACGGGDDEEGNETFNEDGFDLTFSYPADYELDTNLSGGATAGREREAGAGVELERKNGIYISRGSLNYPVTRTNLGRQVKPQYDALVSELAGRPVKAQETEAGGLPALSYPPIDAEGVANRTTIVFDGDVQYQINCQWEDENRAEIEDACDLALQTLRKRSS